MAAIVVPEIYKAIGVIQKDVPRLAKDGVGPSTQGSYKFLAVDDVLNAVKPLLDEHNVIVSPQLVNADFLTPAAESKPDGRVPKVNTYARLTYNFRFISTVDGSILETIVIGEGTDTQDKAVRKATTSAWKIALIQTFALITGEADPDSQDGNATQEKPANPQAARAASQGQRAAAPVSGPSPIMGIRAEIKAAAEARGMAGQDYIDLGNSKFDAPQAEWTGDFASLEELLKAIEAGESA